MFGCPWGTCLPVWLVGVPTGKEAGWEVWRVVASFLEMLVITFAVADGTPDPIGNNSRHVSSLTGYQSWALCGVCTVSQQPYKARVIISPVLRGGK